VNQTIDPEDERYPTALRRLPSPPNLRVAGAAEVLARPGQRVVTVVGSRVCSGEGAAFARELGAMLAKAGVLVVSGGAEGIDAAAHEGALASGGHTAAVLGMGLGVASGCHTLWRPVQEGGGVLISPFADTEKNHRVNYFRRNELMALWGEVTVVVERRIRSGAANTTSHARRHGRLVLAVPQAPWSLGRGCADELVQGARPIVKPGDVLTVLEGLSSLPTDAPYRPALAARSGRTRGGLAKAPPPAEPAGAEEVHALLGELDEVQRAVLFGLADKARSLGELCDAVLTATPSEIAVALFALECRGWLRNDFGSHALAGPLEGAGPTLRALTSPASS
jgi:DNA processing protein